MTAHLFRLRWYTVFFLLGLLVLCTCFAGQIQAELQTAVNRCLTVIIPSLYAMMILSQLFLESGVWQALARPQVRELHGLEAQHVVPGEMAAETAPEETLAAETEADE